jgi:hypothetical protein
MYLLYIFPPELHIHLWLHCSNFFNPSMKNSFGCAAKRKIGNAKDISALLCRVYIYFSVSDSLIHFFALIVLFAFPNKKFSICLVRTHLRADWLLEKHDGKKYPSLSSPCSTSSVVYRSVDEEVSNLFFLPTNFLLQFLASSLLSSWCLAEPGWPVFWVTLKVSSEYSCSAYSFNMAKSL